MSGVQLSYRSSEFFCLFFFFREQRRRRCSCCIKTRTVNVFFVLHYYSTRRAASGKLGGKCLQPLSDRLPLRTGRERMSEHVPTSYRTEPACRRDASNQQSLKCSNGRSGTHAFGMPPSSAFWLSTDGTRACSGEQRVRGSGFMVYFGRAFL